MDMFKCQTNLGEPIEHVVLAPILQLPSRLLLLLILVLNPSLEVAAVGVVHHDAKLTLLRFVDLPEAHNVWVLQDLKNLGFAQCLPPFVLVHILNVDLLDYSVSLVRLALHKVSSSKRPHT